MICKKGGEGGWVGGAGGGGDAIKSLSEFWKPFFLDFITRKDMWICIYMLKKGFVFFWLTVFKLIKVLVYQYWNK